EVQIIAADRRSQMNLKQDERLSGPETRTWNGTISVISNNGRSPGFTKRGPCCDKVFILR
ncbi:hypothetical protein QU862_33930, partial [Escherichia coli]|nr:hypothetical protein [Escherichia coli]